MSEVIVYGGAFNPPTLAHQNILDTILSSTSSPVWLLASGDRTDKTILVEKSVRLQFLEHMVNACIAPERVQVSEYEWGKQAPVETFDTVKDWERLYPDTQFTWVFGADSTSTMGQWLHGEWLLNNLRVLVVPRAGYDINPRLQNYEKLNVSVSDLSSTFVRERVSAGLTCDHLVLPQVAPMLQQIWGTS